MGDLLGASSYHTNNYFSQRAQLLQAQNQMWGHFAPNITDWGDISEYKSEYYSLHGKEGEQKTILQRLRQETREFIRK